MNSAQNRPIALVILDGWGLSGPPEKNAIFHASTPCFDELRERYPSTELWASGTSVGLPDGMPGNAEIGHMNIGSGRILKTDAVRIAESIASGEFFENEILRAGMERAASSRLHLIGLVSDGDIHSSSGTLYALLRMAKRTGVRDAYVHAILDGRDVPPRTADVYIEALEIKMSEIGLGKVASLCGRFFAMDSGENWERTARAFTMLALAEGERFADACTAIRSSFLRGISDEFIAPIVIEQSPGVAVATIRDGDVVVFFNHRADTMRQLVRSIAVPEAGTSVTAAKPALDAVCLTEYERAYNLKVAFPAKAGHVCVASALEQNKIKNYRISDTDRFTHVTDFFNCSTEKPGRHEQRIAVPAANVSMRETEPEMTSFKTTDKLLRAVESDPRGVFIVNLPAADLVAETGNFERTVEAVQYIDTCLGGIIEKVRGYGGAAIITSTHANCIVEDDTKRGKGKPVEKSVPFHLMDDDSRRTRLRSGGTLRDVGATLLALAGVEIPDGMTGRDLRIR